MKARLYILLITLLLFLLVIAVNAQAQTRNSEVSETKNLACLSDDSRNIETVPEIMFEEQAQIKPSSYDIQLLYARVLALVGNYDSSIIVLQVLNKKFPQQLDVLRLLSTVLWWNKAYERSLSVVHDAILLFPDNLEIRLHEVKLLIDKQRHEEARLLLEQLVVDFPENEVIKAMLRYVESQLNNKGTCIPKSDTQLKNASSTRKTFLAGFKKKNKKNTHLLSAGQTGYFHLPNRTVPIDVYSAVLEKYEGFFHAEHKERKLNPGIITIRLFGLPVDFFQKTFIFCTSSNNRSNTLPTGVSLYNKHTTL